MCLNPFLFLQIPHVRMEQQSEEELWSLLAQLKVEEAEISKGEGDAGPSGSGDNDGSCPDCGCDDVVLDEGQHVCAQCGTVVSRQIDMGAEWRYYGDESRGDDPNRCGMATNDLLPKSSLGSMIACRWNDSKAVRKIRMYQIWNSMPYWERTLATIFEKLSNTTAQHGIPAKVIDDAKVLYKQVSEKRISRGDNRDGLIASSIYYACLINGVPRSAKEVAKMFNIDTIVMTRGNARFHTMLKLNVKCSNAQDFISRFGTRLQMNYNDLEKCKAIAGRLDDLEVITENAPTSIAAGTIYYYSQEKGLDLSKKDISEACDVSDPTITKCYKRITKWKHLVEDLL